MTTQYRVTSLLLAAVVVLSGLFVLQPATLVAQAPASTGLTLGAEIKPVSVNLANVQGNRFIADSTMRVLGQRSRGTEAVNAAFRQAAQSLPANANVQIASEGPRAPVLGTNFDSLDVSECCGGQFTTVPPDPDMSAGPNHLIAIVNVAFEIYDKTGTTLVPPTTFDSFFGVLPECLGGFDPTTVYDEEMDRFVMNVDGDGSYSCMAVTQSGDPTGMWNIYAIPADYFDAFHDYPHIGVGDVALFIGSNQFGGSLPDGFEGRVWALDKMAMYAGDPITPISFSTGSIQGTPQPLNLHGYLQGTWPYSPTHYFITDPYDGEHLTVWQWPDPLGDGEPAVVSEFNLADATGVPGGFPVEFPQLGGEDITANDWRMRGFEFRNGHGWTTDTISCDPGTGAVDCVRWSEVDLMADPPALIQAGVYASDDEWRTFPDLSVNACNDMAVGYTKGNADMYPGIWYTGREYYDPPGMLQEEAQLKAGEVTYFSFDTPPYRWGDYTGMTIDPDGLTFWYLGEYSKDIPPGPAANWGTYVGSFTYPECEIKTATVFRAHATGDQEVPPVVTDGQGRANFHYIGATMPRLTYMLQARYLPNVVAAHIHCAPPGENGPIGVTLYSETNGPEVQPDSQGWYVLTKGVAYEPDPGNSCGWTTLDDVVSAMVTGATYVNFHTDAYPSGEVRGQIVGINH